MSDVGNTQAKNPTRGKKSNSESVVAGYAGGGSAGDESEVTETTVIETTTVETTVIESTDSDTTVFVSAGGEGRYGGGTDAAQMSNLLALFTELVSQARNNPPNPTGSQKAAQKAVEEFNQILAGLELKPASTTSGTAFGSRPSSI